MAKNNLKPFNLHKKLFDSLYMWWENLMLKLKHPDIDFETIGKEEFDRLVKEFKGPVGRFNESYDTIARDEYESVLLRCGKLIHILSFEFKQSSFSKGVFSKEGILFKDYIPIIDYEIKFRPEEKIKPDELKREPKPILNFTEFYNSLEQKLSKDFRYTKYFTLPFRICEEEVKFGNNLYPAILVSILTHDNIEEDGSFAKDFLSQCQTTIFRNINEFYKEKKGKCIWDTEGMMSEEYKEIFMLK